MMRNKMERDVFNQTHMKKASSDIRFEHVGRSRIDCHIAYIRSQAVMRIGSFLTVILLSMLGTINPGFAATDSPSIVLFRYQKLHGSDQWIISQDRILATPEWDIDSTNIPIAPETAWRIAKTSLAKQGFSHPQLVQIEIHPVVPESESTHLNPMVRKRYYYRIQYSPMPHVEGKDFDYGYIIILMDGSILDPIEAKS